MAHSLRHKHQAVWIVLGNYTLKIYGVFSTKEGAEEFITQYSADDDNALLFVTQRWDIVFQEHEVELI